MGRPLSRRTITNTADLRHSENVLKTTRSYVPIYTSNVVEQYEKLNSKLKYAIVTNTQKHATCRAVLDNNIVLQNSFDGTQSFKIKYSLGDFTFGNFRLIHRGCNANDFNNDQEYFVSALEKYNKFHSFLKTAAFDEEVMSKIKNIIATLRKKEVNIEYTSLNALDVLNSTIVKLCAGDYSYVTTRGVVKVGRPVKGLIFLFNLQHNITKMLIEEYPEFFV